MSLFNVIKGQMQQRKRLRLLYKQRPKKSFVDSAYKAAGLLGMLSIVHACQGNTLAHGKNELLYYFPRLSDTVVVAYGKDCDEKVLSWQLGRLVDDVVKDIKLSGNNIEYQHHLLNKSEKHLLSMINHYYKHYVSNDDFGKILASGDTSNLGRAQTRTSSKYDSSSPFMVIVASEIYRNAGQMFAYFKDRKNATAISMDQIRSYITNMCNEIMLSLRADKAFHRTAARLNLSFPKELDFAGVDYSRPAPKILTR